jgi:hypothetical protein
MAAAVGKGAALFITRCHLTQHLAAVVPVFAHE